MNIIITGGCGFIGSNLAVALRTLGHEVSCFDNLSRHGSEVLRTRILEHGCSYIHGDVRNPEDFNKISPASSVMIDCSAEPSVLMGTQGADARYMLNVNLNGAINCFEWARSYDVPLLFLSTSRVYPYEPINACKFTETDTRYELSEGTADITLDGINTSMPLHGARSLYGTTKLCAEFILQEYAAQYKLPVLINRCGVIAGPWQLGKAEQGVFTYWMLSHYFNRPLKYIGFGGQGKQVRDILHIDDLAALICKQLDKLQSNRLSWSGNIYNIGGGRQINLSLQETTELCTQLTGRRLSIGSERDNRPADIIWYTSDIREVKEAFDWTPTRDAHQIMRDIFHWIHHNEKQFRNLF